MSAGIQHLIKGNQNREGRVDKIETDQFNSIVERITHGRLNPSKLAAEVTKAKVLEESPDPASIPQAAQLSGQIATWGAGPAHQLAGQRPDAHVNFLAEKVAVLERRLAQYEAGQDNDPVMTTATPAKDLNRGAASSGMMFNKRKKTDQSKDPVDGEPDGDKPSSKSTQKQPEAQMAGEHVNILGLSMTEWRQMTGLKSSPVDLTARRPVVESYEDEIDEGASREQRDAGLAATAQRAVGGRPAFAHNPAKGKSQMRAAARGEFTPPQSKAGLTVDDVEHELWANFLENYDMTPEEFSAFVEAADETGDEEALVAVMGIENEFQEALASSMGRQGNIGDSIEYQLWASFLEGYESTPEEFSVFVEEADETDDEEALITVMELEDEFQEALAYCLEGNDAERQAKLDAWIQQHSVKKLPTRKARTIPRMRVRGGPAAQSGHQLPKKMDDDIDQLWSQWLGERDLSVETFDALVESAETDEDLTALEELQAMFEAEVLRGTSVAGGAPVPDITSKLRHGGKETTMTSVVGKGLPLRSAEDRKKDLSIPKRFLPKPVEDDDAFECDDDGNGHPDMNGQDWTDAMKRLKKKHGKSGRKS